MIRRPIIELYTIGTELVLGRIQDTNSFWIAQQIVQLGGNLRRVTMLMDDMDDIIRGITDGIQRGVDIIITTGGLGPTPDDMTVEAMARLVGTRLTLHEPTLEIFMKRRGMTDRSQVTPNMLKMAMVPEGAEIHWNTAGWAPCLHLKKDGASIFVLPGPPKEMETLFIQYIAPYISSICQTKTAAIRVMVNMYESEVSPLMQAVMDRFPTTYMKAYVALRQSADQDLPIDIVTTGEDINSARYLLQEAVDYFTQLVQEHGKTVRLGTDLGS
jgi:molybdenum cofactor synthesis domain-containing protein